METLNLNQIQERYDQYENHTGIVALNRAIDKVLIEGKKEYETPSGSISRHWINGNWELKHRELVEMRNRIIDREFADLNPLLDRQ